MNEALVATPAIEAGSGRSRSTAIALVACVAVAVCSLALPATLAYDAWAWLVWGRELAHFDLDTTGGPSWKPLPVLVASVLSVLGDRAPEAWLVVARTGGLFALVGMYRLAARLAGPVAGVIAAGLLVLTPDGEARFVRLVLEGHSSTFTATLAVWAVERHLAGRPAQAAVLLTLLSLDRPEAWPFLGLYALWLARREPARRWSLVGLLATVPLLWFGLDWWGSGSPWHGADAAQVYASDSGRLALALDNLTGVVVAPVWLLSLVGAAAAWRRGGRALPAVAIAAVAWLALVIAMNAAFGFAALTRFLLPGAALLCVVAAVAVLEALRALPTVAVRGCFLAVLVIGSAPFLVQRSLAIGPLSSAIADRARSDRDLEAVLDDAGGIDRLRPCGPVTIDSSGIPKVALAWAAGLRLADVARPSAGQRGLVVATAGGPVGRRLTGTESDAVLLARSGPWLVFAVGCPSVPGG